MLKITSEKQIGPRDMICADGSIDWQVLKALADRRAASEFADISRMVATGRLPADCGTTRAIQQRAALKHYRGLAIDMWSAHPANKQLVTFHTVTPFGRQREGVRLSAF